VAVATEILKKVLDSLSSKPLTVYQLGYATNLDPRTVQKYLVVIELIQTSGKMKKEISGSRVFFRKDG
jgi:hypothetical protein